MNVLHISRLRNQDQGSGFAAALILGRRPFQTRRHGQRGVLDVSGDESCQIKERPLESVRAGTTDAVLSEIGEAAVFKPDSPVYASAFALVKGRILGVHLDGAFAREKKDQVIGLLKSAASRL